MQVESPEFTVMGKLEAGLPVFGARTDDSGGLKAIRQGFGTANSLIADCAGNRTSSRERGRRREHSFFLTTHTPLAVPSLRHSRPSRPAPGLVVGVRNGSSLLKAAGIRPSTCSLDGKQALIDTA